MSDIRCGDSTHHRTSWGRRCARAAAPVLAALLLSPLAQAALKVGDTAPRFTTPAAVAGKAFDFDMAATLRKGPVVLYF